MLGSPFIVPFEEEARTWSEKLTSMQDIIDAWLKVSYEVTHALSVLPYSSLFCLPLVPSHVAVLGADLQQRRHHGANAGRRSQVWNRGHLLEGHHERIGEGHEMSGRH